MQEAASKVWSLEQGDLMPEPRPPYPTSAFAAFLLELSPTLSPSPRPCHPGSSAIWEFRHLECQRVCLHFPFVCHRFLCVGLQSLSSGSFLKRKPAAELLSGSPPSNHRAHVFPSRSAACDAGPRRDRCM